MGVDSPVTIQAAILQVLAAKPSHGLAILQTLRAYAGEGGLRMAEGSLYEHLHALEREGLTMRALSPERKRRRGRPPLLYALTPEGQLHAREHYLFLRRLITYGIRTGRT